MNTSTGKFMTDTNAQLVETLWKKHEPNLEAEQKERRQSLQAERAQFGDVLREEDDRCEFADKLQLETFKKVKEELGDKILMELSEPSRFEVLLVNTLIKFNSELKPALAPEFQGVIDKQFPELGAKYDVELDIRETEADLRSKIESKFKLEMLFWSALDGGRFQEAAVFLSAIEVARAQAKTELQVELLNWKLNLAVELKDFAMFMSALKKSIGMKEEFELRDFKTALENQLYRLLSRTVFVDTVVVPSDFGLKQANKSGKTTEAYFAEQTEIFARGVVSETISCLCTNPEGEFTKLLLDVLKEKRKAFLQINPCFRDIAGGPEGSKWFAK